MIRSLAPLIAFFTFVAFAPRGQAASVNDCGDAETSRSEQFVVSPTRDPSWGPAPELNLLFVRLNFARAAEVAEILNTLLSRPGKVRILLREPPFVRAARVVAFPHRHLVIIAAEADTQALALKIIVDIDVPGAFVDPSRASSRDHRAAPNTKHP